MSGQEFSNKLVDLLYNKKLPPAYRKMDLTTDEQLLRYLESLIHGGFSLNVDDAEGIMNLLDPVLCPDEYFPYLCESFGIPYYADIDLTYQRRIVSNFGELLHRRGTFAVARYLVRAITGLRAELEYTEMYADKPGRYLLITVYADSISQIEKIQPASVTTRRYIGEYMPYYITVIIMSNVTGNAITNTQYLGNVISTVNRVVLPVPSTA